MSTDPSSSPPSDAPAAPPGPIVRLPAARSKALIRGVLWSVPAALLGLACVVVYGHLDFRASVVSSRLVELSLAALMLPVAAAAVSSGVVAARWVLLVLWPSAVGITASPANLELRLGPFGARRFDGERITVRYPFELTAEEVDGMFEAFLPEEEQFANLVPRLRHPSAREPLERTILRFAGLSERYVASALRPVVACWRERQPPGDAA